MPTLSPSSEDVRIYECAVLYPNDLSQKEEAELIKEIEGYFDEVGAKLISKDAWGMRGLAYPVEGHKEGKYTIYYFEMDPAKLKEVDQALRINRNVLRHLFVKPPKHYQIIKYSEAYEEWMKTRESVEQVRAREKEEKVKEQVAKRAKKQVEKATTERKKAPGDKPALEHGQLDAKLEELLSDSTDL